jgi:hypothetical protein
MTREETAGNADQSALLTRRTSGPARVLSGMARARTRFVKWSRVFFVVLY